MAPLNGAPSAGNILVVDDDSVQRKMIEGRLVRLGYEVTVADDSASAVRMARATQPDVILLDLGLPGGDGFLVMSQLRLLPRLSAVPIVIVSGSESMTDARARAVGAHAFFRKPVDFTSLVMTIRQLIPARVNSGA